MRSFQKVLLFVAAVCAMHGAQACTGGPDPEDPGLNPQPLPPGPENPAPPDDSRQSDNGGSGTTTGVGGGSTSSGSSSSSGGTTVPGADGGDAGTDGGDE